MARACAHGGRDRTVSRRGDYPCYLLERGLELAHPCCAACGVAFNPPRLAGERFRIALQVFDSRIGPEGFPSTRMFVGTKVLISRAGASLGPLLDRSTIYVGARVMVALVRFRPGRYLPILLAKPAATMSLRIWASIAKPTTPGIG